MRGIPNRAAIAALAIVLSSAAMQPAAAAADATRQITVTGEASVSAAPDMAILNIGVLKIAATAREALDENNSALSEVMDKLKSAGIADKDLQTANFSISPQFDYSSKPGEHPKLVGYQVSNTLTVRVRDLKKLGNLLDDAVTGGVNSGGSLSFTNSNMDELLGKARKDAVKDAFAKAKELTEAAGVKAGAVLSISENSAPSAPGPVLRMTMAKEADAVPVAAGENEYQARVTVTMSIEP